MKNYNKDLFFTNREHQNLLEELQNEILTSDEVNLIFPFISKNILNKISLTFEYCEKRNVPIKIITTTFDDLSLFNNLKELEILINKYKNISIKIEDNYEKRSERIHIKASIFKRKEKKFPDSVIIGSSNLTFNGMVAGREWNVKIIDKDDQTIVKEMINEFEKLWNEDLVDFNNEFKRKELINRISDNQTALIEKQFETETSFIPIKTYLYDFQKDVINKLRYRRFKGKNKHLVVMATGTGKTLVSAFDYKNQLSENNNDFKLLFIAHQKEIVDQALKSFRQVLNQPNFGEVLYEGQKPNKYSNHLFATVQTLSNHLDEFDVNHFDYIIFDEVHHIAAKSFDKVFNYFKPKQILGLTATPEREDGKDIKEYFAQEFAYELRVWDAIDQKLLCPFDYYCIDDTETDLTGLDLNSEKEIFKAINTQSRNNLLFGMIEKYMGVYARPTALIFCVTTEHAKIVSNYLSSKGLRADYLTSENRDQRNKVINDFKIGRINYLCVVNMFNEGIDVPEINTIILLRPTNSKTVYLQQLGRGLRKNELKRRLEIYDLISNIDNKYDLTVGIRQLFDPNIFNFQQIFNKEGLPYDSTITLEKRSQEMITENLKHWYKNRSRISIHVRSYYEEFGIQALEKIIKDYEISMQEFYNHLNDLFIKVAKTNKQYLSKENDTNRNKNILKQFIFLDNYEIINYFYLRLTKTISVKDINLDFDNLLITSFLYEITSMEKFENLLPNYLEINDLVEWFMEHHSLIVEEIIMILKYKLENENLKINSHKKNELLSISCIYTVKQTLAALGRTNFLHYRGPLVVLTFQAGYLTFHKTKQLILADEDGQDYGKLTKFDRDTRKFYWSIPEKMTIEHKIISDFENKDITKYLFIHNKQNYSLDKMFLKLYEYVGIGQFEKMIINNYLTADFNVLGE